MRLERLSLKNFKGIRELVIDMNGKDVSVCGRNATGKTTIMDAYVWLLLGKDSLNRSDFELKTLTETGEPIHNLEHEVEAVFSDGAERLTLKKRLTEKWTKKRGSTKSEFTGHTVDHFVDGVPVSQREYAARIARIADETTFRLITNPRHFSDHLKWQERRRILLEVCGDVTDAEVIENSDGLSELPGILGKRTLDEHRKVVASRRTEINRELEQIPVRISELRGTLPDDRADAKNIRAVLVHLRGDRDKKAEELTRIKTGGETAELTKQLRQIEAELIAAESARNKAKDEDVRALRLRRHEIEEKISALQRGLKTKDEDIAGCKVVIDKLEADMQAMRDEWHVIADEEFLHTDEAVCPTCGQSIPEERIAETREKALADFNESKARKLSEISETGKEMATRRAGFVQQLDFISKDQEMAQKEIERLLAEIHAIDEQIEDRSTPSDSGEPSPEEIRITTLKKQKNALESRISELALGSHDAVVEVEAAVSAFNEEIWAREADLAKIEAADSTRKRIAELERNEKDLSAEFERTEYELNLCDTFIRRKVEMLTELINSKFNVARFKLFDSQINGGITECCEVSVNGVPHNSLNNGMRINVGLDICETLSAHYGVELPIFIDNAESVNELYPTKSQQVRLLVSGHETLSIETEEEHDGQEAA
jgi:hypothetical protein